jgi:micrococcal nuclease
MPMTRATKVLVTLLGTILIGAASTGAMAQGKGRSAAAIEGRVDKVVDGDSLWFVASGSGQRIEIRLRNIDAPEICQDGGAESRQALLDLVAGKTVMLQSGARDAYGRTLGQLSVEGQDVARRQVLEGQAWSSRARWDRGPLVAEERTAVALKRGLHAVGNAEQPKAFRARNGPCAPAAPAPPVAAGK